MNKAQLENRLIDFSVQIYKFISESKKSELGIYLGNQLMRSSISPALNYAEAQGAESQKDFIHKLRIALKELREVHVSLRIMLKINEISDEAELQNQIVECNELISIFVASIKTASKKI